MVDLNHKRNNYYDVAIATHVLEGSWLQYMCWLDSAIILRGRIKGFNSAIYAIKCQQVVIELWLGSYSTVVG